MEEKKRKIQKSLRCGRFILAAILFIGVTAVAFGKDNGEETEKKPTEKVTEEEKEGLSFPYKLDHGKLEVTSIFQFSGMNPDCDGEDGDDIAALTLKNLSDKHITSADVTSVLEDGTEYHFKVTDIPTGETVMAFSVENASYENNKYWKDITCTAEYEEETPVLEEKLTADVQGTDVTLTNHSGETLSDLNVFCHCVFEESYFGGLTYCYPVESIEAGQSVTIQAMDCYLGEAAVVRISQDN